MSFAEKITGLMARPNQQPTPVDDQPWYLKYGVRILGIVGGFCQAGKIWQKSVQDENLEILCVSQFASYHRLKGNKPDFHLAMQVDLAQQLYQTFLQRMGKEYNVEKIKVFILFGFLNALGIILFKVSCLISGISQVLMGFIVIALEAPCCFFFIDHVSRLADVVDTKPLWYRAVLYIAFAIIPLFLCFGVADLFASILLFGTGVGYGMMGLGKKASASDMRQAAASSGFAVPPPTNDRAGIVNNAQPFSFTGAVGTDSNV